MKSFHSPIHMAVLASTTMRADHDSFKGAHYPCSAGVQPSHGSGAQQYAADPQRDNKE